MTSRRTFLAACAGALALPALAGTESTTGADPAREEPIIFYVVMHSPGKTWKPGTAFQEQPGVMAHVEYMSGLLEAGTLAFGGPFLDDSGGMALFQVDDLAEIRVHECGGEDGMGEADEYYSMAVGPDPDWLSAGWVWCAENATGTTVCTVPKLPFIEPI